MKGWLLLATMGGLGCTGSTPERPALAGPVTALITVDTWRVDHFDAVHTPTLWALAEEGTRFSQAWAPMGLTSPSHATMLTGLMPWEHGLRANNHHGYTLDPGVAVVPEAWPERARGAFVSAFPAGPEGGLDRGWQTFDGPESGERPGSVAVDRALSWLEAHREEPVLLWVHVYEPHGPYEGTGATERARYAEEVARADALLAPLVAELRRAGGARIVVASDHGEILDEERCGNQHERSSREEVLHVPLATWPRLGEEAVVDELVSLADVPALLRGERPPGREAWLAESGTCETGCTGCAPSGLAGRDAVALDLGGRWTRRPGRGTWAEGSPGTDLRRRLDEIPGVPAPEGSAREEELQSLGYLVPGTPNGAPPAGNLGENP